MRFLLRRRQTDRTVSEIGSELYARVADYRLINYRQGAAQNVSFARIKDLGWMKKLNNHPERQAIVQNMSSRIQHLPMQLISRLTLFRIHLYIFLMLLRWCMVTRCSIFKCYKRKKHKNITFFLKFWNPYHKMPWWKFICFTYVLAT